MARTTDMPGSPQASGKPSAMPDSATAQSPACFIPQWLEGSRAWGIAVQLYELRSSRNWGIGDFADLAAFCQMAARAGADFVGVNPLHALFMAEPRRCSPFSPSSRRFLNPLYIAVDRVEGFAETMAAPQLIRQLADAALVDYEGVAAAKLKALRALWAKRRRTQRRKQGSAPDGFAAFCEAGGEALRLHALFEALSLHLAERGAGAGWTSWPQEYRDPQAEAVAAFAARNDNEIAFHMWLQWLAARQLAAAHAAARAAGMRIGLYLDMAVGEAPDGSATWSRRDLFVAGASIGAPPDVFTAGGQDWGLAALAPEALSAEGGAVYRELARASMQHAGALRIDHAMSLRQLFLVPAGEAPAQGAHARYPQAELVAVLAEASAAHGCVVVGEDLGHVPEGFRDEMAAARILSYRILYFEQREGAFLRPRDYPQLALACLSTHDLPTFRGWWRGDDVRLRRQHGLIDQEAAAAQATERAAARNALIRTLLASRALKVQELMPARDVSPTSRSAVPASLVVAAHRFVAQTPSLLMAVRLADLAGEDRPANLPGTTDSYPNWRTRSPVPLELLERFPLFRAITSAVAAVRPRTQNAAPAKSD